MAPGNANPVVHGSPRIRDLSSLRAGGPGSAFRGIGRNGRGGRGGRNGGRPTDASTPKVQAENPECRPSRPDIVPLQIETSSNGKTPTSIPSVPQPSDNGSARGGKPRATSRSSSRVTPKVVVAPTSPTSESSPVTPSGASRSGNRRRRPQQQVKGPSGRNLKPPQPSIKPPKGKGDFVPSVPFTRKDTPPHLVAAHEAGIRHDIEALVDHVRAVAMAEHRPTTPGSHFDWAGDEDDSLPDLSDWGIPPTAITTDGERSENISPILGDALKQLPEPHSDAGLENPAKVEGEPCEDEMKTPPSLAFVQSRAAAPLPEDSGASNTRETLLESSPSCSYTPNSSTSSNLQKCPDGEINTWVSDQAAQGETVCLNGGLSEPIHPPSSTELVVPLPPSHSSDERGLSASIHAPALVQTSSSAPNLSSDQATSAKARPPNRNHGRSHTESRPGPPPRSSRSDASSPLGKHVYTHSRNHSTPTNGPAQRVHHASRPVITGEAMSRLVRTIGNIGPGPRSQGITVSTDSTVAS